MSILDQLRARARRRPTHPQNREDEAATNLRRRERYLTSAHFDDQRTDEDEDDNGYEDNH